MTLLSFSALQRAEIAEITSLPLKPLVFSSFSALQRAEIAEKWFPDTLLVQRSRFSALQRAEIAEIAANRRFPDMQQLFQCSSTSRNC